MIGKQTTHDTGAEVFLGTTLLALPVAALMCGVSLAGFDLVAAATGGTLALGCLRRLASGANGPARVRAVALAMLASLFLLALAATLVDLARPANERAGNESLEGVTAY